MNVDKFIEIVTPNTMTSVERIKYLYESMEYLRKQNMTDDIVECGVWKGGNMHGVLEYLHFYNMKNAVWLYDTYNGMTEASIEDKSHDGQSGSVWNGKCNASIESVKKLIDVNKYPNNCINFIVGDVCETLDISTNIPKKISLLRLDTDWYKSTKKELEILFPFLCIGGILIVDDYGHWNGSKKAVLEYFENKTNMFKQIDYTGVSYTKKDYEN